MKKRKNIAALFLTLAISFSLTACGGAGEKYKTVKTLENIDYSIGCRNEDSVGYYVLCALKTLEADGTISSLANQWFGKDEVKFESDAQAISEAGYIQQRTLIVGVDAGMFPMSYVENGNYCGFNVELFRAVCDRLGWELKFISIQPDNAYVELSSGNVDVAVGDLALEGNEKNFTVIATYMADKTVICGLSDSSNSLSGKKLVVDVSQRALSALDNQPKLKEKFGQITRLTGGIETCFDSLDSGEADVILATQVAVDYYNRH